MSVFLEAGKLQSHLRLLREEYVKLQEKHSELEKKYQVLVAASGQHSDDDNFVSRLLRIIADLFDKELYRYFADCFDASILGPVCDCLACCSDMEIKLRSSTLHGHKFVLAARSDKWDMKLMASVSQLDLSGNMTNILTVDIMLISVTNFIFIIRYRTGSGRGFDQVDLH